MIYETIVSSVNVDGEPHLAPFGVQRIDGHVMISPFKPSATLENILVTRQAVINLTDDVRVFAGALTGRLAWTLVPTDKVHGFRLMNTLAHQELQLVKVIENEARPQLFFEIAYEQHHQTFQGFNRAQSAVIEMAVLTSRLHLLPKDKVMNEIQYLKIAIDKTSGERELQAWTWLLDKVENFYAAQTGENFA